MSEKSTPSESTFELSADQKEALAVLETDDSVFLTGEAGSGKSFVLRQFLKGKDPKKYPSLASTGAAAVLVGGRTFHSFMGLGILEGGREKAVERALEDKRLRKRLQAAEGFVLDEVSMLSGETLSIAEEICRLVRDYSAPWGGLRVVAVGDFAQLPPVEKGSQMKNWAFEHEIWEKSAFVPILLRQNMRTQDDEFLSVLNDMRMGKATDQVQTYLERRRFDLDDVIEGTRLYPRRYQADNHNMSQLSQIDEELFTVETFYQGADQAVARIKAMAPIPEVLHLKIGAYVMMRVNDPKGRFVNGSTGHIRERTENHLIIELVSNNRIVSLEKSTFQMANAEGTPIATASNFPVNLAYAVTIHKAQGLTVDRAIVDLRNLWEPGQAYVAASRVKAGQDLFVEGWDPKSIRSDLRVQKFYDSLSL